MNEFFAQHSAVVRDASEEWGEGGATYPQTDDACYGLLRALAQHDFTFARVRLRALLGVHRDCTLWPHLFEGFRSELLLRVAELVDFWDMPTPWARACRAEVEARGGLTDGAELARSKALTMNRLHAALGHMQTVPCAPLALWERLLRPEDHPSPAWLSGALAVLAGSQTPLLQEARREAAESQAIYVCVEVGDVDTLQALLPLLRPAQWPRGTMASALTGDAPPMAMLRWLLAAGCPVEKGVYKAAAKAGNMEVLRWARDQGCPVDDAVYEAAAAEGHMEVLRWARDSGVSWEGDGEVYAAAARAGHLAVMRWAKAEGCPWDGYVWRNFRQRPWCEQACAIAASGGHIEVLQWLRSQGCAWGADACSAAALHGHLPALQWLHAQGCPWDADTCTHAAHRGDLAMVQWLRTQGCPWSRATSVAAVSKGHMELFWWAANNGCP